MCLIAYVPSGGELADDVYRAAFADNSDGIGIMSRLGVVKFLGKKMLKRARRYVRLNLAPGQVPYAIHFRFATHGDVTLDNTHPFVLPDGQTQMMHNGIISWCGYDKSRSDTGIFADLLDDYSTDGTYLADIATMIGFGNKLCLMNADGSFSLVNADAGLWDNGVWYSNTYSLPDRLNPWAGKTWKYDTKAATVTALKPYAFRSSETWLEKYDAERQAESDANRYAPRWWSGTDYDADPRLRGIPSELATQRDDDSPSDLHDGCGLPIPSAYRTKEQSQRAYYQGLEADGFILNDDYAEASAEMLTEDEAQQRLDNVLLAMRQNRSA